MENKNQVFNFMRNYTQSNQFYVFL